MLSRRSSEASSWMKVARRGIAADAVAPGGGAVSLFSAPDAGEQGDGGVFTAMPRAAPALALTVAAALPAVAPRDFWAVS